MGSVLPAFSRSKSAKTQRMHSLVVFGCLFLGAVQGFESGYGTLAPSYTPQRSSVTYPSHGYYPSHLSYDGYYPVAYPRIGYSESGYGTLAPSYIPQRSSVTYLSHGYYPGHLFFDGYYPSNTRISYDDERWT